MIAYKFNQKTGETEEVRVNNSCVCLPKDIHEEIPCAYCGKEHDFATMYCSEELEDGSGRFFAICEKCREKETKALDKTTV